MTKMDRLPTEILELIYLALLPIPPCAFLFQCLYPTRCRIRALERLRLVSKKWNNAVLNTPELWSYIEVSHAWSNVHLQLERAKSAPLHVRIHVNVNRIDHRIRAILEAVWGTAERWDTFVIANTMVSREHGLPPPTPLPNVREIWVTGIGGGGPKLHAPRIETLFECFDVFVIEDSGLPSLRSWRTGLPATTREWERFTRITQQCPKLRSLQITSDRHHPRVLDISAFTASYSSLTLPLVTELSFRTDPVALTILPYIRAPCLELLVIEDYSSFTPFSIPSPSSCPALSRLRFKKGARVQAIQEFLSTVPKNHIERVTVEIEYSEVLESAGRRGPAGIEELAEQRKWIDEKVGVRWIHK